MNLNFTEKTSLNILTNLLRTAALALIGVFMVPYYVASLGIAAYAILPLATTMSTYVQIISDSIAYAAVRYNTLAFENDDTNASNTSINSSFFGMIRVCLILMPLGILLAIASPAIFNISGSEATQVQLLFGLIIASSFILTMSTPFEGVFYASNNLYLMYLARLGYFVVQVITIVALFAFTTPNLMDIGLGYVFASITVLALFIFFAKRTEPEMRISHKFYDKNLFKKIGTLGAWSLMEKIGGMLYINLSLVLVNLYLGTDAQGGFAIITTMLTMINNVCYAIVDSINPYIYKCYAENREEDLTRVVTTGNKLVILVIAFPTLFLIIFCNEFLGAWLGTEYEYLSKLVIIGTLGNLSYCSISAMTVIPRVYLKMKGITLMTLILGIANVAVTIFYLGHLGGDEETAILIWAICMTALSVFTAVNNARITHARPFQYLAPMIIGAGTIVIYYFPLKIIRELINIPASWIPLIVVLLVTFLIYFLLTYILLFTKTEKEMVMNILPQKISRHLPNISLK